MIRPILTIFFVAALAAPPAFSAEPKPEDLEFFEKKVRPVLATRCFKCHGPKKQKAGLRLDSRAGALKGGESGPAVVPGKPEKGYLIDAINYGDTFQMPPDGKLKKDQIAAITRWVRIGAPWPGDGGTAVAVKQEFNLKERAKHWSFQPIRQHAPPAVKQAAWPRTDADRFILAKLEAAGLQPAGEADRRTWIRRVHFALIGLPPEPAAVEAFVNDQSPRAFEKVVDGLLRSPHFGERWARHWLDLVRYAESRGHEFDYEAPNVWHYRDYVIRAFNADVPYNQFVHEHIAGDLVEQPRKHPADGFNESILGTGFWFLGEWVHSPVDVRADEAERFDNMIDVMSKSFLGLTVACARCHDHKFDAIAQTDYYALYGFLQSSSYRQVRFDSLEHNRRIAEKLESLRKDAREKIVRAVFKPRQPVLRSLDQYLLAARDAIGSVQPSEKMKEQQATERAAAKRKIDAKLLARWVAHLRKVKDNANDPLHFWSVLSHDAKAKGGDPEDIGKLLHSIIERDGKKYRTYDRWRLDVKRSQIIADYSMKSRGSLMADGFGLGSRPAETGTLLLSDDPRRPLAGVVTYGHVRRDPAFRGLKLAPGTQNDPGRLGGWVRAGQTFRTPTFTIEHPRVHFLARGAGRSHVVVDSHRLNQGPLHGSFLRKWNADVKGSPKWHSHDVSMYRGHRAHIEFSPEGDAPMEIYFAVQADDVPKDPSGGIDNTPESLQLSALNRPPTPENMAVEYRMLIRAADEVLPPDVGQLPAPPGLARTADWLLKHGDLFTLEDKAVEAAIRAIAEDFLAKEKELRAQVKRVSRTAPAMWDGQGEDERLFIRGNHKTLGDPVPRRFLTALASQPIREPGSGRLRLARQMTDPVRNPFVTRVIVNRIWHHLFGRGIVQSVDNFGVLGKPPTHPELLDHLATRFAQDDWSIKRLIRSIVLSSTYRMSSDAVGPAEKTDPANLLLHRMPVRRLEAEAIRDSVLAVSGRLDRQMFGAPVPVHLTPFMQGRGRPRRSGPVDGAGRRSVYISIRRNFLSPMMLAFDMPIPFTTMGRRNVSNVPAQALIMMNDPFVVQQAGVWAARVLAEKDRTPRQRIDAIYRTAFARPPSQQETADALAFLVTQAKEHGLAGDKALADPRVWTDLCHVLMNVKEFVFVH